ncbi:MAG: hypothetical protein KDB00_27570 [Planctomycetales bacterium]|nr:hypothetical protein [Planctomycetales bacterium]
MIVNLNRPFPVVLAGLILIVGFVGGSDVVRAQSSSAVARSIMKYFGKEGAEEATEYLARQGGRELAERVGAAALREGGEGAAEHVSKLAAKYGPEALSALDNAPQLAPVLAALQELPEAQVKMALARLSAGSAGRELAETIGRVGTSALRSELKHPGVGGILARVLGDDGAELATKLSTDQAIAVARHADDLAALPSGPREGVMMLLRNDAQRMVGFMGRFAADNPGKTLFTAATTTIILAESERILGGDEIVFDADGNPIVVSKAGIAGRTMKAGGEALGHVSSNYIQPLFLTAIAFVATFATLFMLLKLWHAHQREKLATALMMEQGETVEGAVVKKE